MTKIIDITEKLDLSGNPILVIQGDELEVNADAATVLKIMGIAADEKDDAMTTAQRTLKMYDLLFPKKSRELIEKKRLSFNDLQTVISEAMNLAVGGNESEGEVQTHTMI